MEWRPTGQVSEKAHAQELKGPLLQGGRGRRHVEGRIAPGRRLEPDAGPRGEMLQQVGKAPNRQALGRASGGRLASGLGGWGRRRHDRWACGRAVIVEQKGLPGRTHGPFDIIGQHAQQNMGADTMGPTMIDGPNLQVHGLEATKGALHRGPALVGPDGLIRIHDRGRLV